MEEKINKQIGEALKNIRKNNSIKKKDLTDILGVSLQQLSKYENGTNRISAAKLLLLLDKLGVSFDIFFNNKDKGKDVLFFLNRIKSEDVKKSLINLIKTISLSK